MEQQASVARHVPGRGPLRSSAPTARLWCVVSSERVRSNATTRTPGVTEAIVDRFAESFARRTRTGNSPVVKRKTSSATIEDTAVALDDTNDFELNLPPADTSAIRRSESSRRSRAENSEPSPDDPLGIYLKDVGAHDLLEPEEEHLLLGDLIFARNRWIASFLGTEAGFKSVHQDLQRWKSGEMAARSLVPGPPKPKPGREDSEDHVSRLFRIFERHVARRKRRPFQISKSNNTDRLLGALLFVGLRPGPLKRYKDASVDAGGRVAKDQIRRERELFVAARRPLIERNLRLVLSVARKFDGGPLKVVFGQ